MAGTGRIHLDELLEDMNARGVSLIDERARADTDLPLEERKIGGLGIHIVRKMMDKVSYRRRIDKNVITVFKYLAEERK